jgi:hypothetical protein
VLCVGDRKGSARRANTRTRHRSGARGFTLQLVEPGFAIHDQGTPAAFADA